MVNELSLAWIFETAKFPAFEWLCLGAASGEPAPLNALKPCIFSATTKLAARKPSDKSGQNRDYVGPGNDANKATC